MGRVGSALDNAISESFVATLKAELLVDRSRFPSREIAKSAIFEYLEASITGRGYTPRSATKARRTSRSIECESLRQHKGSMPVVAEEFHTSYYVRGRTMISCAS